MRRFQLVRAIEVSLHQCCDEVATGFDRNGEPRWPIGLGDWLVDCRLVSVVRLQWVAVRVDRFELVRVRALISDRLFLADSVRAKRAGDRAG